MLRHRVRKTGMVHHDDVHNRLFLDGVVIKQAIARLVPQFFALEVPLVRWPPRSFHRLTYDTAIGVVGFPGLYSMDVWPENPFP